MNLSMMILACFILYNPLWQTQKKRCYPTPFITVSWDIRIMKETYSFNNETGGPSTYVYDCTGLLYHKVFTRSDGFTTATSFDYHPDGRLRTSLRLLPDGRKMVFTYGYDDSDHLVTRIGAIGDSTTSKELYSYDSAGILEKAFYTTPGC